MLDIIRSNAQSWVIKIAFGLIILVFVFWGVGSFQGTDPGIIMKVNGTPIMLRDFAQRYEPTVKNIQASYPNLTQDELKNLEPALRNQVLQTLLLEILLAQEAKRTGIVITPQELRALIETFPIFHNEAGKFSAESYLAGLAAQGLTPAGFEEQVSKDLLVKKFKTLVSKGVFVTDEQALNLFSYQTEQRNVEAILFKTEAYMDQAKIGEADITAYYNNNQKDFEIPAQADVNYLMVGAETLAVNEKIDKAAVEAFYQKNQERYKTPERVKARHILIMSDKNAPAEEDAKAKAAIEEAAAQIKAGKPFAEVAKAVSQDGGSGAEGGELGWFAKGQMVPEFEEAAFKLNIGQLSAPVRSQFGWHLIEAQEKAEPGIIPMIEVEAEIQQMLAVEAASGKVQEALDNILIAVINGQSLADAAVKYNLTVNNTGLQDAATLQESLGLKPVEVETLIASPISKVLETAFSTPNGYVIAQVKNSIAASTQPLTEVKADIEEILKAEAAVKLAFEAATKAREGLSGTSTPDNLKANLLAPAAFNRDGYAQGFAQSPELAEALFSSKNNDWLPIAYNVEDGAALIRLKDIVSVNMDHWVRIKPQLLNALQGDLQEKQYVSFVNALRVNSKIEIVNLGLLEPQAGPQ